MLCVLTVSVLFTTVFQVGCVLQSIGPGQYENQNVSRPNHGFCHFFVNFKEFFVEGRLEYQNPLF